MLLSVGPTHAYRETQATQKARLILIVSTLAWLFAVGVGLRFTWDYESSPGQAATPAKQWPGSTQVRRQLNRATLIMFAHPRCPCTRASIGELAQLMALCQSKVTAYVLFLKPVGTGPKWEQTDLWRSAAAIPGVQVRRDDDGLEARRFHAETSGQTILFDRAGHLIFSGGITALRGHSGDNAGRDTIVAFLTTGRVERNKTVVFGCSLRDSVAPGSK